MFKTVLRKLFTEMLKYKGCSVYKWNISFLLLKMAANNYADLTLKIQLIVGDETIDFSMGYNFVSMA